MSLVRVCRVRVACFLPGVKACHIVDNMVAL